MRGPSYHGLDYAFGHTILTLRARIGLTQVGLAAFLGVSRKAISDWERGSSYPQPEHLKQFIALAIQQHAFPAGQVSEEVHAIWQDSHQKILFDEAWLEALLPQSEDSPWDGDRSHITPRSGNPLT
jgi:transcriptional regulator with XRE-family HTH domain